MKVLKPLLWFLVPTVIIWVAYFFIGLFVGDSSNVPNFAGSNHYLRLFMQDDIFLTALGNTLKITLLPAFVISLAAYFITVFLKVKSAVMYGVIFLLSALAAMFARYILFDIAFNFNLFDIFCSLQCGIVCSFICFLINIIFKKFVKKNIAE